MQTDPQEISKTPAELTNDETWDSMIQDFVHQNCELSAQFVETLSPKNFQSALEDKMKSIVSLFIKSHLKKLSEYKALTDLQEDNLDKMKSEVATLHEENDQLNEMSLRLIREIKRLKKYVTESDIFVSILRGEIYKQKHQNKVLVDALKQLYEGNEELATKILTNAFSDGQESPEASLERVLTSPDRNRRQRSLAEDKLLLGPQRNYEAGTARSARKQKKNSMTNFERGRLSGRAQALSAVMTPDDNRTVVNENEEYNESNRLDDEGYNEIYSLNDEDEYESEIGNGSVVMSPHQIHLSESPKRAEDIELSKIKSLLTEEKFDITNFLFESKILKTRREQSQKLSTEQRDTEIENNIVRVQRLPKWLRPHKIVIPEVRRIERITTKSLDEMARVLSKSLQVRSPKNIRRFTLDLKDCQCEMDEPMKLFATKILRSLTQLKKLSISFKNGANVSEEFIETIGTIIRRQLRDLQALSLDLSTCRQVTDRSLKDLGSMIGYPLSKLKCLSISIERCRSLTGTGLKAFGSHLTFGLRRIHHLSLDFAGCFFDREGGFEGLMIKIFQRMKLLRSLDLNMANYGSLLSTYREINTSEFWRPMPELQHLSLNLSKCNILKDSNVASLLANISTCLLNLQSLHLSFEKCEKISDECFQKLNFFHYQKLTLLRQFNISFLECPKITGKGLDVISSKIAHNLIQIKHLDLSFGDFQSRDLFIDDNLEKLGIEISRALSGLTQLVLRFHYCRMITDRGLKVLGHEIAQNLQNLKAVTLVFHKCAKVTIVGRESLNALLFMIPNKELYTD